jgi:hypothetical protein
MIIPRGIKVVYMTVHQHDSSQPQQSQDSPQPRGLGLMMVEMEEAVLAGMVVVVCGGV